MNYSMARTGGTTGTWRELREQCFRIYGTACVICGDQAKEIDHIIELNEGGTDTIDNLQPLCKSCHARKTAAYNSRRMKKPENNGFFLSTATHDPVSVHSLSPMKKIEPPMAKN